MTRQTATQTQRQKTTDFAAGSIFRGHRESGDRANAGIEQDASCRSALRHNAVNSAPVLMNHEGLRSPVQPLDNATRDIMAPRFGHDFSQVRVNNSPRARDAAQSLNAMAHTFGNDIGFGKSAAGLLQNKRVAASELAHAVPQEAQRETRSNSELMPARSTRNQGAPDAGTGDGPQDAGPIAGAPTPTPTDAGTDADGGPDTTPMQAGPTGPGGTGVGGGSAAAPVVTVDIGKVTFRGTDDRIAPTKTADVAVKVTNLPSGGAVKIDVDGSGGANGTATVTKGATLKASGTVTVRGDKQTAPGNAGKLKLRATVGSTPVAYSPGFTVAAYPINYTEKLVSDIDTATALGLVVQDGWSSDGSGSIKELDEVELSERVDIQSRDDPPFTSSAGTSTTSGTSGYMAANAFSKDTHSYGRGNIDTSKVTPPGSWTIVYGQVNLFKCKRTGVTDQMMPNCGYTITHKVWKGAKDTKFKHQAIKTGAAVTVESRASTAGAGTAKSKVHTL